MKFGKTIKIFLTDGDPNGRMTCELSGWTGKAYKTPGINIKDCSDRADLSNTGVYLLLGKDEVGNDLVYIGEAESILSRLNAHLKQKDFWNEVIVFVSKDDNLNKAHIKYLENRLYEIATIVKRYKVENSNIPTQSSICESDRAEMEEFIGNIKMLVNSPGHKVFDDKRELNIQLKNETFYIKAARGADGQGEPSADGFVVFKGSKAATSVVNSSPTSFIEFRQKLINEGLLILNGEFLEFSDDYIFSSPSTAAAMTMGRNANGLTEWKQKDGKTLKDFETNS